MKKLFMLGLGLSLSVFALSCGGGGESGGESAGSTPAKKAEAAPMAKSGGYSEMTVANGGTVSGNVTFAGTVPAKTKLEVTKDVNVCGQVDHYSEDMVVSADKGLANVVVSIKGINSGKSMASLGDSFELDQHGCAFVPHVSLVPVGAELTILNSDGILHNIHTFSSMNEAFNKAQPPYLKTIKQTFDKAETFQIKCDVHAWMSGYITIVDHPYHAVSATDGNFSIADVPAGTYTVEYWQETLGKRTMEVTVAEGGTADASIEYTSSSN